MAVAPEPELRGESHRVRGEGSGDQATRHKITLIRYEEQPESGDCWVPKTASILASCAAPFNCSHLKPMKGKRREFCFRSRQSPTA